MSEPSNALGTRRVGVGDQLVRRSLSSDLRARAELGDLLCREVESADSHVVFAGMDGLDEADARTFVAMATELLGQPLAQDVHGALIRDVRYRGVRLGEGSTGRYSDSRDGGSLHTDGPHMPGEPPDHFTLFCVRQSRTGGDLILVHRDALMERLSPDAVRTLGEGYHFDRRSDLVDELTLVRPILTSRRISYLREYIEIGHAHPDVPMLKSRQRSALDELDQLLNDRGLWRTERLVPGEFIVIDNRVVCHGRTAFRDSPEEPQRLMLRTWIRRSQ
ncbi:TauD/TfdA family dioxygenase [Streptomyces sp. CAU 1734]|uniref:TauD/TfdA family dioxygenase n=1 Tax=Streptomyces sp. CAU 1734 TaxID=3140360 RepID=UPI0032606814